MSQQHTNALSIMSRQRLIGITLTFVSGVLFATLPILFRIVTATGVNLATALALRFLSASALIWGAVIAGHVRRQGREGRAPVLASTPSAQTRSQSSTRARAPAQMDAAGPRSGGWPGTPGLLAFILMGVLYIGQAFSYLSSSVRIPIATTSLLLYTYPAIVTVLARAVLREPLTRAKLMSLVLALAGTLVTLGTPQASGDWVGIGFGLAAALIYSTYIIIGTKAQRGVSPALSSAIITLSAGLFSAAYGLATGQLQLAVSASGWLAVAALGSLSSAIPILFFLMGVERIGASQASIISTSELVSTALFGALFLGEALAPLQLVGGVLIMAATMVLARAHAPDLTEM